MVLKKEITNQIKDILKENPQGLSITDIVKAVKINRNTVGRYLENLLVSGQMEMRRFGMAKIYTLSQRVPLSAVLSLSSELVAQLDSSLRFIFANEPFLKLIGTKSEDLIGKNIEYTPVITIFYDSFPWLFRKIQDGLNGKESSGEISPQIKNLIFFFRIAPTVFENGRKGVSVILEDITEQKLAEKALRESEVKFRSITENSPDMILMLNQKLEISFINRTYTLNPEQVRGKSIFDFIPQEFYHAAAACFEHVLKSGELSTYSTEYYFANGETLYFESTVGPVFQDGTVTALVINAHDITKRRKAEKVLQESEDRYRQLVDISPDAVIIHQQGKIIFINPAALSLFGASHPDELIGINILDFIQPKFHDAIMKNIEKDLDGNITPPTEVYMLRIDGTSVIVEGRGVKTNINGKPAIQVALRDITERKRAELALVQSERQLADIINFLPDATFVIDRRGRVIAWNKAIEEMTGIPAADMVGKNNHEYAIPFYGIRRPILIDLIFESDDTISRQYSGIIHKNGKLLIAETEIPRLKGRRAVLWGKASPLYDVSGTIIGAIESIRDVTEWREMEDAIREREEQFTTFMQTLPIGVFRNTPGQEGVNIMANPVVATMHGFDTLEEFRKYRVADMYADPEERQNIADRLIREGRLSNVEIRLKKKNGDLFWARLSAIAVPGLDGTISYFDGVLEDITDRKKVDLALHESEERLRLILDSTDDLIIMQDPEGRYLYFNSAARYGVSVEDVLGLAPYDFVDRESADRLMDRLKNVVKTGQSIREETPMVWKGQAYWFSDSLSPVRDKKGTITAVVTISHNITERKQAEMALRESESKLTAMLESITDIMSMIDRDLTIIWANEPAKRYFGIDIIGKKCYEVYHLRTDPCEPYPCLTLKAFLDGKTHQHDTTVIDNKGEERFFECTANVALRDNSGKPLAVLETSRDITDKKKAEMAFRESEATARALMNAPTDSVILMDAKGIILALNETAALRFGKRSEELVGILADDLLPEELAQSRRSLITQVLEKKKMVRFEDERDGRWFDTVAYPIVNETGDVNRIAIIARDITDRKKTEEALTHS